ncbi:hypothetical protein SAMN05660690_1185 [Geodermatophilus telluris]|uniref:Uncharacterized protein n=1 Tax=Geodermatophilus telluris TaxID=1190417 RepID=A0A1G6L465_9ACTN|nr:hypothetical protein [Geodermatophilus telluris]SDC37913.1 hypothetical protein SAMN05660690_1185 [Geodermatophilus telluris]
MTSAGADPGSSGTDLAAQLRRMALHLETAAVLELRAARAEPRQGAVLRRRAEQRRQEAARLRERLAACGAALPPRARRPTAPSA